MTDTGASATIVEVVAFEDLPFGEVGSRRAVVRWSDGSVGEGRFGGTPTRSCSARAI